MIYTYHTYAYIKFILYYIYIINSAVKVQIKIIVKYL